MTSTPNSNAERRRESRVEERERKLALLLTGAEGVRTGDFGRFCKVDLCTPFFPPLISVVLRVRLRRVEVFQMRLNTFEPSFSFEPSMDGCFELEDRESEGVGEGEGDTERGMKKPLTLSMSERARFGRSSGSTMSGNSSTGGCGLSMPTTRTVGDSSRCRAP